MGPMVGAMPSMMSGDQMAWNHLTSSPPMLTINQMEPLFTPLPHSSPPGSAFP